MPEFVRMIVVLCVACGIAAGSLSLVNAVTREPIAAWELKQTEEGLKDVFTAASEFPPMASTAQQEEAQVLQWEAVKDGQVVGHVFQVTQQGYGGPIVIMFGVDQTNAITGMKILRHTETPGLGAKITSPELFRNQFQQKQLAQVVLKKDDPTNGAIDALTAATISSRAVTRAIHDTFNAFLQEKGGK
jgi:electron transport complex protein RnfG